MNIITYYSINLIHCLRSTHICASNTCLYVDEGHLNLVGNHHLDYLSIENIIYSFCICGSQSLGIVLKAKYLLVGYKMLD